MLNVYQNPYVNAGLPQNTAGASIAQGVSSFGASIGEGIQQMGDTHREWKAKRGLAVSLGMNGDDVDKMSMNDLNSALRTHFLNNQPAPLQQNNAMHAEFNGQGAPGMTGGPDAGGVSSWSQPQPRVVYVPGRAELRSDMPIYPRQQ